MAISRWPFVLTGPSLQEKEDHRDHLRAIAIEGQGCTRVDMREEGHVNGDVHDGQASSGSVTGASRFLTGLVTCLATHDGIRAVARAAWRRLGLGGIPTSSVKRIKLRICVIPRGGDGAGGTRTHDWRIMRSTASCTTHTSGADDTGYARHPDAGIR